MLLQRHTAVTVHCHRSKQWLQTGGNEKATGQKTQGTVMSSTKQMKTLRAPTVVLEIELCALSGRGK